MKEQSRNYIILVLREQIYCEGLRVAIRSASAGHLYKSTDMTDYYTLLLVSKIPFGYVGVKFCLVLAEVETPKKIFL